MSRLLVMQRLRAMSQLMFLIQPTARLMTKAHVTTKANKRCTSFGLAPEAMSVCVCACAQAGELVLLCYRQWHWRGRAGSSHHTSPQLMTSGTDAGGERLIPPQGTGRWESNHAPVKIWTAQNELAFPSGEVEVTEEGSRYGKTGK